MSNICKTVTLRTRKIKGGEQLSFYLDYYPGYRDESTMKVMRHESLGIYIYANRGHNVRRITTTVCVRRLKHCVVVAMSPL